MLAALMLANTAVAGPMVSGEAVASLTPLGESAVDLGTGYGLRFGLPIDIAVVELQPEVGVTIWRGEATMATPRVGGRFSFGKILEPGAYAHFVYLMGQESRRGWDAGVTLDFTAIPKVDLGVQAGLLSLQAAPTLTAGAQIGIKL